MINPIALEIFGLKIYWYGLTYAISFILGYFYIKHQLKKQTKLKQEAIDDIFFYFLIFSVLGGRIFEIIFYNPTYYISNPLRIFAVWQGGMSIHGGILFGFLTLKYHANKHKINTYKLTDLFVIPAALALAFGRLANFINQELVGTITTSRLGIVFPLYDNNKRFPTQLFESAKNMITFQTLFYLETFKKLKTGTITALFLILYNLGRFFIDFLREPTTSLGIISMGQLLCIIYTIAGIYLLIKTKKV